MPAGTPILKPMSTPKGRFHSALTRWFLPGAVYTFVGAGGKTTGMKQVAAHMAGTGVKARLTTTTKVAVDEFSGFLVSLVKDAADFERAVADSAQTRLVVAGSASDPGRYQGLQPALIEGVRIGADAVLLVEGDGSRQRPMKAPQVHEPVIPSNTATVFAVMGASAFDEPMDERHCYNFQKALALVGRTGSFFEPGEIARLAGDPEGCFKGVRSGMGFRLLVNQGDLEEKRETACEALWLARQRYGIAGAVVSFQKGELYESTAD
jgi:probable selenium-dependent hydroxylase accessory protein YqeC